METKIAVVQLDCIVGNVDANMEKMERFTAAAAAQGAHVVIFPETGTTGYFVGDKLNELAEEIPGPATQRLGEIARHYNTYVMTGIIEKADAGHLFNSAVLMSPQGKLAAHYRKCHLFSAERQFFSTGDDATLVDTEFGRVALTICYDLVFPEYIRSLVLKGAKLILNSTDWITNDWQTSKGWGGQVVSHLAATRALENTIHVAMADRTGYEEGWKSIGHSCICPPSGGFLARIEDGEGMAVAAVELDSPEWDTWRSIATYLPDRRLDLYERLQREAVTG